MFLFSKIISEKHSVKLILKTVPIQSLTPKEKPIRFWANLMKFSVCFRKLGIQQAVHIAKAFIDAFKEF